MPCTIQVCIGGDRRGTQSRLEGAAACMCLTADNCEWELCGWAGLETCCPSPESDSWPQLRLQPTQWGCHDSCLLCGLSALTSPLAPRVLLQPSQAGNLWTLLAALWHCRRLHAAPGSRLHLKIAGCMQSVAAMAAALCYACRSVSDNLSACPCRPMYVGHLGACAGPMLTWQPHEVAMTPPRPDIFYFLATACACA